MPRRFYLLSEIERLARARARASRTQYSPTSWPYQNSLSIKQWTPLTICRRLHTNSRAHRCFPLEIPPLSQPPKIMRRDKRVNNFRSAKSIPSSSRDTATHSDKILYLSGMRVCNLMMRRESFREFHVSLAQTSGMRDNTSIFDQKSLSILLVFRQNSHKFPNTSKQMRNIDILYLGSI